MKQKIRIPNEIANDVQWLYTQDWEYCDYGDCKRHLQIIFPFKREWTGNESYPLILFIPGSAWHKQEMYNDIPQYAEIAKRGFAVIAMEYRESEIASFPAQIEDVSNALKFIATFAEKFHIDMKRLFLMGNSSGAHIALMAALFNANGLCEPLPKISGVIAESAPTDILLCAEDPLPEWFKIRPSAALLGVEEIEGNEDLAEKASCSMYINDSIKLPPILLIHSEFDPIVSVENSRKLYEELTSANKDVLYYEIEGNTEHGGPTFFNSQVLDIIQDFCDKHND